MNLAIVLFALVAGFCGLFAAHTALSFLPWYSPEKARRSRLRDPSNESVRAGIWFVLVMGVAGLMIYLEMLASEPERWPTASTTLLVVTMLGVLVPNLKNEWGFRIRNLLGWR